MVMHDDFQRGRSHAEVALHFWSTEARGENTAHVLTSGDEGGIAGEDGGAG